MAYVLMEGCPIEEKRTKTFERPTTLLKWTAFDMWRYKQKLVTVTLFVTALNDSH